MKWHKVWKIWANIPQKLNRYHTVFMIYDTILDIIYFTQFSDVSFCCNVLCNPLWPSDAIWPHRSGSVLAQALAWCLMVQIHYFCQCWPLLSEVNLWAISNYQATIPYENWIYMKLKNITLNLLPHLRKANQLSPVSDSTLRHKEAKLHRKRWPWIMTVWVGVKWYYSCFC